MWQAIQNINSQLAKQQTPTTTPASVLRNAGASSTLLKSPQEEINLSVLQVLQTLKGAKDKKPDIPSNWKHSILPPIVCTKILETNDQPENTYGQRAYVKAAKVLLKVYELNVEDSDAASDPEVIDKQSAYYDLAVLVTESIKAAASALAFPHNTKPGVCDKDCQIIVCTLLRDDFWI